MFTFEDKIEAINLALSQHSNTWTLKARPDMDYDDVSQIIRKHIWAKWKQWDQELPLEPWVHTVIRRQLINITRNVYGNMARPCLRCPQNMGDDLCKLYTKQCAECPLYEKWERTRKKAYNVRLPLPIENHQQETNNKIHIEVDYDKSIKVLNQRLKEVLKPVEWQVYELCTIQKKTNKEAAEIMNFKFEKKYNRYKRIEQIMDIAYLKSREILKTCGIE